MPGWLIWLIAAIAIATGATGADAQGADLYWQRIEAVDGSFMLSGFTQHYGERADGTAWTAVSAGPANYTNVPGRAGRVCIAPSFGREVEQRGAVTCWNVNGGYWSGDLYVLELVR